MKRAFSKRNLWDKTPRFVKSAAGGALSRIPLPLLLGGDFRSWYRFASDADHWDAERVRNYQVEQLRHILSLAHEKTEFYREMFKRAGFEPGDLKQPEDIRGLPTIDKATVRDNWERMLTRPITDPDIDLVTTGGTSGEPLRFYASSSRHAREFAHLTMAWGRVGYKPGDAMAVFRGRVITKPAQGMYYGYDPLLRHHYYSTFHMSPEDLRGYVKHINRIRPKFLHAYPSSLYALARFCLVEDLSLPDSIYTALLESEPILPHQRDLIEKRFGLRMFAAYGHSEKLIMAAGCEKSDDYHLLPTYGYCETLTADAKPASEGALGELTGTGFINQVMPLIRYRTGDMATVGGRKCRHCGREHLLLKEIQGRWGSEFLVCRDGHTLISMTSLNLHDDTFDGIMRFQFVQDEPGKAVLQLIPAKSRNNDPAPFRRHFEPKLGHGIDLEVRFVPEIPLTRMGKQPMILQRCKGIGALTGEHATTTESTVDAAASSEGIHLFHE